MLSFMTGGLTLLANSGPIILIDLSNDICMAWKNFANAAAKFGMSVADRARLKIAAPTDSGADPFADYLRRRGNLN